MESFTSSSQTIRIKAAGPFARVLYLFFFILFILLGILIAIPLLLIALFVGLVLILYLKIKHTLTKAKSPNGPLDGRQNVKVINRNDTPNT